MGFDRHGRRFPAGLEMADGNDQRHDSILEVHLPFFAVLEDSRVVWIGQRGNADKMSRLRANGIARLGRTNFENFAVISKTDNHRPPTPGRKLSDGAGGMVFAASGSRARNW